MNLEFQLAEMGRRLANLVRVGTVEQADYQGARVRVRSGEVLTGWLPWVSPRAGPDRDWVAPEVGEQVMVFSPSGELAGGVALCGIPSAAHPPTQSRADVRETRFADGAAVEYDRAAHRYSITLPPDGAEIRLVCAGKVSIAADGDVTLTAGNVALLEGLDSTRLGSASASDPVARRSDLAQMKQWADAHVHGASPPPSGPCPLPECSGNVRSA